MTATLHDLTESQRTALADLCTEVRTDPERVRVRFPAAAREVARTPGTSSDPGSARVEDLVRVQLLQALASGLRGETERLLSEVRDLYRFGDADERRAVLLGLPDVAATHPDVGGALLDLVHDALRTNDPRLVAAALGPYAAAELDGPGWRQGVLKCLFTGVPLSLVSGLGERTDAQLVRMVADYADERRAAGRPVPDDALSILATTTRES